MALTQTRSPRRTPALSSNRLAVLAATASFALTGCGMGTLATSTTGAIAISGTVHGGQQPISGANIYLYTAGTTGNGSAARSMLMSGVQTGPTGGFNISSDYTCANSTDQVYLVASQGNPGLGGTVNNPALILMDALGNCSDLLVPGYHISIDEATTAAAAWALAPFMTSYTNVGASATNATGLANAFADAHLLADPQSGDVPALGASQTIESGKLLALADALAPCVNSDGTTGCTSLFAAATPAGGTAPTNTLNAALNIVKHPGQNVTAVFKCINASAPFPTTLTSAPNDWTMSLTVAGGGLYSPEAIAIDAKGNLWTVGQNNPNGTDPNGLLAAFSPQGIPYTTTGYGVGTLSDSFGLAIDNSGYVWVTNWENPGHNGTSGSLSRFTSIASGTPGTIVNDPATSSAYYYDSSLDYPNSLATDSSGSIYIANYANSSASVYNSSGNLVSGDGGLASGSSSFPTFVASDGGGGFWLSNSGDNTVTHVNSAGTVIAHPACCSQAYGLGIDLEGNAWVGNYGSNSISEVSPTGSIVIASSTTGGIVSPSAVTVDAAQNVWVVNYRATRTHGSVSELAGNGGTLGANGVALTAGTAISPSYSTVTAPGGYGLDAGLLIPNAILPDASGNLWISNTGNDDIVMLFGLATPTATPLIGLPTAP